MTRIVTIWYVGFACAVATLTVSLVAQTNMVGTNAPSVTDGGIKLGAFGSAQIYIDIGTLFIGAVLTAAFKKWGPSIPKNFLPYLATLLGILAGGLFTVTLGDGVQSPLDVMKTVALALGNVTIRELKDKVIPEGTLKKLKATSPPTKP